MCSVDRRRYRDGGFNGQWTSQLAPSQCSGTLFSLGLLPLAPSRVSLSRANGWAPSLFSTRARIPGLYATWKASGLKRDITEPPPSPLPPPLLSIPLRPSLLPSHGTQKTRGPILSAEKFIARSTLIGREIIGHSFPLSARSKRRSLIHDFSRIIAGPCLLPYPPPFLLAVRATVSPRISFPHPCSVPTKNSLIKTSFERASRFSNQR